MITAPGRSSFERKGGRCFRCLRLSFQLETDGIGREFSFVERESPKSLGGAAWELKRIAAQ